MMAVKSRKNKLRRAWFRGGYIVPILVVLGVLLGGGMVPVRAAPHSEGFTVSPAQLVFTLNGQDSEHTTEVTIVNNYAADLHLVAELNSIDESSVTLLPAGPLSDAALSAAISLSATDITIPPGGTYKLQVQVRNTMALQAGGHYASLVLTQQVPLADAQAYRSALAVSLFVIKTDGARTDLQLLGTATNRWLFRLPTEVKLRFRNDGNVVVVPRASASVYASNAKLLAQGIINTDSRLLFPGQEATYTAPVAHVGRLWVPQKVHLMVAYRAQGDEVQTESKQTFWYIPPIYLLLPLLPVAVIAAVLLVRHRTTVRRVARERGRVLRGQTERFARQATPVAREKASIIWLATQQATRRLVATMKERRTAYVAWRLKRAEEKAAIEAARDAVKSKPIDLWASDDFHDYLQAGESKEHEPEHEGSDDGIDVQEAQAAPEESATGFEPKSQDDEAALQESEAPLVSLSDAEVHDDAAAGLAEVPVADENTQHTEPQGKLEPEVPKPESEAAEPVQQHETPEEPQEAEQPPERPTYKPVDYPGLRRLGLIPGTVPKPEPAKQSAEGSTGVKRVPQLVRSTKTTLPAAGKKPVAAKATSGPKAVKSAKKTTKKPAASSPKRGSSRSDSKQR